MLQSLRELLAWFEHLQLPVQGQDVDGSVLLKCKDLSIRPETQIAHGVQAWSQGKIQRSYEFQKAEFPRSSGLFVIAERFDHTEHFFVGNESAAMDQLVRVNRLGQFIGVWRKFIVTVRELPTFLTRIRHARIA